MYVCHHNQSQSFVHADYATNASANICPDPPQALYHGTTTDQSLFHQPVTVRSDTSSSHQQADPPSTIEHSRVSDRSCNEPDDESLSTTFAIIPSKIV